MKALTKKLIAALAKPLLSKIHQYKDAYRGQSCYLMGNGVSLKWFDLAAFADKTVIPCNFLPFHNDFGKLDIKHLLFTEPWFFYPLVVLKNSPYGRVVMNPHQSVYRKILKQYPRINFLINLSNYPVLTGENLLYVVNGIEDARVPADFITNRTNSFAGSLRASITLAAYMGFNHCYLVGHDYTHVPSRSLHFYEKGQGIFIPHENYNKEFLGMAKEFIDITTITLDGTSDSVNAVTYKEHTGRDPIYRENTELVAEQYLRVLATWPGYSIY